jgi:hypothetical protein
MSLRAEDSLIREAEGGASQESLAAQVRIGEAAA